MSLPKVHICGYCGKAFKMEADRRLPVGEHLARIDVSRQPCPVCKENFGKGDVTQADTQPENNRDEKKKS